MRLTNDAKRPSDGIPKWVLDMMRFGDVSSLSLKGTLWMTLNKAVKLRELEDRNMLSSSS